MGEGYACVGTEGRWEISVHPSQFYYKPKAALNKIKSFFIFKAFAEWEQFQKSTISPRWKITLIYCKSEKLGSDEGLVPHRRTAVKPVWVWVYQLWAELGRVSLGKRSLGQGTHATMNSHEVSYSCWRRFNCLSCASSIGGASAIKKQQARARACCPTPSPMWAGWFHLSDGSPSPISEIEEVQEGHGIQQLLD